ncbi:hypothetical protein Tchl_0594 [Thauera chlorobenzoica]|uniref:Uncharacterized protein n=1 Tax=Thauera chlorobenzoica TaxID=96773 RepID=A0A1L6F971_9RHOO|nr:hypothetical protein Tchl_0594 [Thauera chlorobenzoica]
MSLQKIIFVRTKGGSHVARHTHQQRAGDHLHRCVREALDLRPQDKVNFTVLRGSTLHPEFRPFSESAFSTGAGFKAMIAKVLWWHVCNIRLQT